jgi:hypothetical protein
MPREKITDRIDLHLTESMKQDLQDMAMREDRKVSDLCRHILACWLYGHQHSCVMDGVNAAMSGDEGQP